MAKRSQSSPWKSSSHPPQPKGDLDSLRKLDSLLSLYLSNRNDSADEVVKHLQTFFGYLTDMVNSNKFSSMDLVLFSQVSEKVADFVGTDKASNVRGKLKSTLAPQWAKLNQFFAKLSDEAVIEFGANMWLALSRLLLSCSEFKLLGNEWNEIFLPMEHWFNAMDGEAVEICLKKWNAFLSFVGSKAGGRNKRNKLIPMFCKPLRSRTLINKLKSAEPIIEGYTTLVKTFKDVLDEHFDELVICFLRFLSGRSAVILNTTEEIEKELSKPIDSKSSKLILSCAHPSHLEYITDDRHYQASDKASAHLLPVICAILEVDYQGSPKSASGIPNCGGNPLQTQKYAIFLGQMVRLAGNLPDANGKLSTICSCFAALAQRIGCIEEVAVKRSESRLLFVQIKAFVSENNFDLEELEGKFPRAVPENYLSIVLICQKLLEVIEKPSMIRNMFLTLSDLLKDLYDVFFGDDIRFKDVSRAALDAYLASPSKSAQDSSQGKQHARRSKICRQASDAENSTPGMSMSASKSGKRQKKRSFSPVDSQADGSVAPKKKAVLEAQENQPTPTRYCTPGTKRRNFVSLLDEDSVDYVPIASSDSAKKMKLTDRQKEIFSEKRERMPFLDEDSQPIAVITNLQTEFDLESSQSASLNSTVPVPALVKKETTAESNSVGENVKTGTLAPEDVKQVTADAGTDSNNSTDASSRRRSKVKLNFDKLGDPTSPVKRTEPNMESEDSVESSGDASAELSVDSDIEPIKQAEKPPRSRRTQKKGTPTKYVAKKRRSIVKSAEKEKSHRPLKTSKAMEAAKSVGEGKEEIAKAESVIENEEMQPLPEIGDVLATQGSRDPEKKSDESGDVKTSEKSTEEAEKVATAMTPLVVRRLAGTPGILKKVNSPSTAEKKLRRVHFGNSFENNAEDATSTIIEDAEKALSIDEQFPPSPKGTLKVITPRRPFAHVQPAEEKTSTTTPLEKEDPSPVKSEADLDDLPIFTELMECQESIVKIVGKLVPVSTNTGSITLRKTLEARGIVQIRHLASMSRREIAALNIKRPRLRRVHFDNNFENNAEDATSTIIEDAEKALSINEQFPPSPKGTLKVITPRRPFAHVQPIEEKTSTTTPLEKEDPSPVKSEADLDDLPIFTELMECQESIVKIVGKLVPVSTNTGSITLRKTLEARGIVQIRHLASMSRREIAALNIKRPRVETTLKALTQFARDYIPPANKPLFKAVSVPEAEAAAVPSEEPLAVLPGGRIEEENVMVENANPDGEDKLGMGISLYTCIVSFCSFSLILEEIVATGDVAEAAVVSPTKEAAEPVEMLNSDECSADQPQPDPLLVYTEKLRQWRETGMLALLHGELGVLLSSTHMK
ncbi:hypothetical protein ANCDUO_09217 [Ancylostoma duodenale]|uniref:Telomere-associated protein Rif1 N-terminal domain-containing protein n=1 Tax=Ancylostoma duodenale TaxID=51022 RepID=A0A0C2GN76_9BILA|nr:hypothetical protein ANCDUO_09217 [Ancylostoma duodenale]